MQINIDKMSPTTEFNVAGDIEVAQALASLGNSSAEQLTPSIERDERRKRYVKFLRSLQVCDIDDEMFIILSPHAVLATMRLNAVGSALRLAVVSELYLIYVHSYYHVQ
jgi:hypothetical protein